MDELAEIVGYEIKSTEGVVETETLVVQEE